MNAHDVPVGRARLCRGQARYLITCGEDQDLWFKLWNLQTSECEHKLKTGQIKHRLMAHNKEHDLFAVAAGQSELRVFCLGAGHAKSSQQIEKLTTLTWHKQAVTDVAFAGDLCVSVSATDMTMCLTRLNL